jgi:sugar/nucleoside kinase (ribokinase family)
MFCYIFVAQTGERVIVGMNADDNPPTPPTVEMIERCRVLTLDLYGGDERVEAARIAKSLRKIVIVGDVREADHPVLAYTDLAIASAAELAEQGMEPREFSAKVMQSGACNVIVTNGSKPVRVFGSDHSVGEIVPPEVEVVDTTGAGDAFRAGTVYATLIDMTLMESAALGTAVGSLIATAPGATSRVPDLEMTMKLARSLPRRSVRLSDLG